MPATIYPIASTGAMLDIGQERSRENTALAAEPGCTADSNCASAPIGTIELSKKVSGSYNHPSGLTGGRCLTRISLVLILSPNHFKSLRQSHFEVTSIRFDTIRFDSLT
jgi:hypothetical protein